MMNRMYKQLMTLVVIAVAGLGISGTSLAQAPMKIGFIDLQKVIDASEEGKRAQAEIKQKADEISLRAKTMKEELQAAQEEYQNQALALSDEARRQKQDQLARLERDYNRFISDSKVELRTTEQRALKQLLEDVGKIIVKYAEDNNFDLILESGNILYGAPGIEITDDIINIYNSQP